MNTLMAKNKQARLQSFQDKKAL